MTKFRTGIYKNCLLCGEEYYVQKARINISFYCSKKCHLTVKNSTAPKTAFKKGLTGKKSVNWKGDQVGYSGLHRWVYKTLGKPNLCENCGTENAKKYEWANISKKYKRNIADWKRLCTSCHHRFDGSRYKMWETIRKYE